MEARHTDINKVVEIVSKILEKLHKGTARETAQSRLKDNFSDVLQYLNRKKDKDVLETVLAKITCEKRCVY